MHCIPGYHSTIARARGIRAGGMRRGGKLTGAAPACHGRFLGDAPTGNSGAARRRQRQRQPRQSLRVANASGRACKWARKRHVVVTPGAGRSWGRLKLAHPQCPSCAPLRRNEGCPSSAASRKETPLNTSKIISRSHDPFLWTHGGRQQAHNDAAQTALKTCTRR